MDKVKVYVQKVVKPWYVARDFVAAHPNVALWVVIALLVGWVTK